MARPSTSPPRRSTRPTRSLKTHSPTAKPRPPSDRWDSRWFPASRGRHRRQLLQRQGDPLRGTTDGHGRRARDHGTHRDRGHGHGMPGPRRNRYPRARAGGRAMRLRSLLTAGVAIAAIRSLAACGDTDDQDFCRPVRRLGDGGRRVSRAGPSDCQGRGAASRFGGGPGRARPVPGGGRRTPRHGDLDAPRQHRRRQTGRGPGRWHEALETARPLLEESLEDVAEAWAALKDIVDVQCNLD